jgi:hypothetical protein
MSHSIVFSQCSLSPHIDRNAWFHFIVPKHTGRMHHHVTSQTVDSTSILSIAVTVYACILQMPGSSLKWNISYCNTDRRFPQSHQAKSGDSTTGRPQTIPSKSSLIHRSRIRRYTLPNTDNVVYQPTGHLLSGNVKWPARISKIKSKCCVTQANCNCVITDMFNNASELPQQAQYMH